MLEVNAASAGVWTALTGAAHGDPELRGYFDLFLRDIRRQNSRLLGVLAERGWLREDLDFERAVDTWEIISCVETYVGSSCSPAAATTSTGRGSSRRSTR